MRDVFHEDLDKISDDLVEMTKMVGTAMKRATRSLLEQNLATAESVITADDDIDILRRQVDNRAVDLLARQQPVATDLRMVVTAMHMASDIERMGDLARHVAKVARIRYPDSAVPDELRDTIIEMAAVSERLIDAIGEAITDKGVHGAIAIEKIDDEMDRLHRKVFSTLLGQTWTHGVEAAVDATLIGRYYERFGDHAVAVANRIIYLVTGRYGTEDEGLEC